MAGLLTSTVSRCCTGGEFDDHTGGKQTGQMSPEIQNRGINGLQKDLCPPEIKKKKRIKTNSKDEFSTGKKYKYQVLRECVHPSVGFSVTFCADWLSMDGFMPQLRGGGGHG